MNLSHDGIAIANMIELQEVGLGPDPPASLRLMSRYEKWREH